MLISTSLTYEIVADAPQVRIVASGDVTMAALIAVVYQVAADPRFQALYTVTLDLRNATYTAELPDGDMLAEIFRRKETKFLNSFALVVPESLHFLARLYCSLAALGGFDRIRCFTSMDEAVVWCRRS